MIKVRGEFTFWYGAWRWRYHAACRLCTWHTPTYPAWLFQRAVYKGTDHLERNHG